MMFSYDSRAEIGPILTREVARHRWEVAGPRAYPSVTYVDTDLVVRGLTRTELLAISAVIEALAELVSKEEGLADAWLGGEPVRTDKQRVPTAIGNVEVSFRAPLWLPIDDEPDPDALARASAAFMERFETAPEATPEHLGWVSSLLDYASSYYGKLVHEMSPAELDELLFEMIPRKVSVEPDHAPTIVAAVRALLGFAARELGAESAQRCLEALPSDASQRLARRLADPRNFGMAKSFVMAGMQAGFDMTSEAGFAAFLHASGGRLPSGGAPQVRAAARKPAPKGKLRTKRKAARKARKKSRR
jgi:hypothetical protein